MIDMPNFWWCPTHHLYRGGAVRPCADAVKLGDVDALRTEIRAVLDHGPSDAFAALVRIRAIVDREPAREEPQCTCSGCQSVTEDTPKYHGSGAEPLPDGETEWGCRDRHGRVHSVGVENETQARAMLSMTPVRREVGPWIEVPRG